MSTPLPRLLTVREAAELANCHEETIRRAYWAGHLKVQPLGSRNVRITEDALRAWIELGMQTRRVA